MSFGWAALAISAFSAINGAEQQRKQGNIAKDAAKANAAAAEEANNRANQRKPNSAAAMAAAILAGKSGQSGTMLSGPQGVDASTLMLGKASLLSGGFKP